MSDDTTTTPIRNRETAPEMDDGSWVLAIDFGTSYTVAASRIGDARPEVIEIGGERRIPSVVLVTPAGEMHVGSAAENLGASHPGRSVRRPKTRLGQPAPVILGGRAYAAGDLVAEILREVYADALRHHGSEPGEVRLTHPATWNSPRRNQLRRAAIAAGMSEPVLVPEPVAAAISFIDDLDVAVGERVLVYDLGGGTFDTAALEATTDGFVVIGRPGGDASIGGELFDELVAQAIGAELDPGVYERIEVADDPDWVHANSTLRRESRRAKEALSSQPYADVVLPLPTGMARVRLTVDRLEEIVEPHLLASAELLRDTATAAGLDGSGIAAIHLVGGASRTPLVERVVRREFPDVEISRRGDPKSAVALGATHPRATPTTLAQNAGASRSATVEQPGPPPTPPHRDDAGRPGSRQHRTDDATPTRTQRVEAGPPVVPPTVEPGASSPTPRDPTGRPPAASNEPPPATPPPPRDPVPPPSGAGTDAPRARQQPPPPTAPPGWNPDPPAPIGAPRSSGNGSSAKVLVGALVVLALIAAVAVVVVNGLRSRDDEPTSVDGRESTVTDPVETSGDGSDDPVETSGDGSDEPVAGDGSSEPVAGDGASGPVATHVPDGEEKFVGLSLDAGVLAAEEPFNALALAGYGRLIDEQGVTTTTNYADAVELSRAELLRVQGGATEFVTAVGFLYADDVATVAVEFPGTNFAVIDDAMLDGNGAPRCANCVGVTFAEEQGSFLAGAAAALTSQTGNVGFVGGVGGFGLIERYEAGFTAGARAVSADIVVQIEYVTEAPDFSGFGDATRARDLSLEMYASGADVVYQVAGASGSGVFEAARDQSASGSKVWSIGSDFDQHAMADPSVQEFILTSMVKRVDTAVFTVANTHFNGQFTAGNTNLTLADEAVGLATSGGFIDGISGQLDEFAARIIDGSIVVPTVPDR